MKFRFSRKKKVVGIDLGHSCLKAVLLALNQDTQEVRVLNYAMITRDEPEVPFEESLRLLWNKLGTRCQDCVVALWPEGGVIRMFESATSLDQVREQLKAEVQPEGAEEFALDCAAIGLDGKSRFIGCAMPEITNTEIETAVKGIGKRLKLVQLVPIAIFNAFVVAYEKAAREETFLLVDIGSTVTTILGGRRGELRFSRTIEWGIKTLEEALICDGGMNPGDSLAGIPEDDDISMETIRAGVKSIARDIAQSLQFLQGQGGAFIQQVYLSGWLISQEHILAMIEEEVTHDYSRASVNEKTGADFIQWNPLRSCTATDIALSDFKLLGDLSRLPAASGAAFQYLL